MPRSRPIQTAFDGGEISPRMLLRVDTENYRKSLRKAENVVILPQGPAARREGHRHVTEVKASANGVRLIPFIYSPTVSYVLEMGPLYVRYFTSEARLESGGAVEDTTTYAAGDLFNIHYAQKNDELLMTVQTHPLKVLTRTSATTFTFADYPIVNGPYELETTLAITAGATSGSTTMTAGSAIFAATDTSGSGGTGVMNRWLRVYDGTNWFNCEITAYTSTTVVTVSITGTMGGTALTQYRLGAFSTTSGFPTSVSFFENRLVLGGTTSRPTTAWLSKTDDYVDFDPGTGLDAEAIEITLASKYRSDIKSFQEGSDQMFIGTEGGVWRIFANGAVLTPSDRNARRIIGSGVSTVQPISADNDVLFIHRDDRQISKVKYDLAENIYNAPPISLVAEHLTTGGFTQAQYQESPEERAYFVRADGELIALGYVPSEKISAFSRFVMGGTSAVVESVCVIPVNSATDGKRDQVWVTVARTVNGATYRSIEFQRSDLNMDCCLTYSGTAVNGTIGGLTHLVGETVYVVGDGERLPNATVDGSGEIDLGTDDSWATLEVGLSYSHKIWLLNPEFGHELGAASGSIRRYPSASFYLIDSVSLNVDGSAYSLRVIENYDAAPTPVTQFAHVTLDHDPERDIIVKIEDDEPFDFILAGVVFDQSAGVG